MEKLDFLEELNEAEEATVQGGRSDLNIRFFNQTFDIQLTDSPFDGFIAGLLANTLGNPLVFFSDPVFSIGITFVP